MSGPIARYFASLGFRVEKSEIKKVNDFLGALEKGLKKVGKEADIAEKSEKKVKKVADEAKKAIKEQTKAKEDQAKTTAQVAKSNDAVTRSIQKQAEQARKSAQAMQATLTKIFPSMGGSKYPQRRKELNHVFGQLPTNAQLKDATKRLNALREIQRKAVASEVSALGRISQNVRGRAEAKRMAIVGPEAAALGRIGANVKGNVFRSAQIAEQARDARMAAASKAFAIQEKQRLAAIDKAAKDSQRDAVWRAKNEDKLNRQKLASQREVEASEKRILSARERDIQQRVKNQEKLAGIERKLTIGGGAGGGSGRGRGGLPSNRSGRSEGGTSRFDYLNASGAGGAFARYGVESLPFVGGAYGFSQLNKANQEVLAARMQTQAVDQAFGGTKESGTQNFEWLQKQADRVGFDWLESVGDYNTLRSNLVGAGGSSEDANTIFKGFAEYGRVNKLSNARQKLVFNALGQIAGKNQLQAEELTRQLGNSLPGAKSIFAEAWQRKTGGKLTGDKAIQALEEAMKKRQVKGDILTIAAQIASEKAAPGLGAASKASQAEQNRFKNSVNKQLLVASDNGVEEGFVRFWKLMADSINSATPLVKGFAGVFDRLTESLQPTVTLFKGFNETLETFGKVSGISEKTLSNMAVTAGLLATKFGRVYLMFEAVTMVLEDLYMGFKGEGESLTGNFLKWLDGVGVKLDPVQKGILGVTAAIISMVAAVKLLKVASAGTAILSGVGKKKPTPWNTPENAKPKGPGVIAGTGALWFGSAAVDATIQGMNTSTEEYAKRMGVTSGDSLGQDLLIRAVGVLADLGNSLTFGLADEFGKYLSVEIPKWTSTISDKFTEFLNIITQGLRSWLPVGITSVMDVKGAASNPNSPYYNNPTLQRQGQSLIQAGGDPSSVERNLAKQSADEAYASAVLNSAQNGTAFPGVTKADITVKVDANITAQDAEQFVTQLNEKIKGALTDHIGEALLMMPMPAR